MDIKAGDLEAIQDEDTFVRFFVDYAQYVLGQARLYPQLSRLKVIETHGAWLSDLERVNDHEPQLGEGWIISSVAVISRFGFGEWDQLWRPSTSHEA